MTEDFEWLSLDDDEELIWSGNPKLQRLTGIEFTDYVLTDHALYRKSGIFSRSVQKIKLEKVQNISYSQGILGKSLGYGTIEISTAGGSGVEMRFRGIENPKEVQETINRQTRDEKEQKDSDQDVMHRILEELKAIRSLMEES